MGGDFIFIFIQIMDGEKDPRNLVLCFEIVKILAQEFPLGKLNVASFMLLRIKMPYFQYLVRTWVY